MMNQEGVIKFNCHWIKQDPIDFELFDSMNYWRNRLHELGLIGLYDDGLSYGNISIRSNEDMFIITGSATGGLKKLIKKHYTKVIKYNIETNSLTAQGPIIASSESLTHAAIYQSDHNINAVLHVHHKDLWQHYLNTLPTSSPSVEYGTPAMANEITRLYHETEMSEKKIMIMGGHQDGIITFGSTLEEAGNILLKYCNLYK